MLRNFLLVGAIQGFALWLLWKARELHVWPNTDTLMERGLIYLVLALPLAIYLTEKIASLSRSRRLKVFVIIGVLFPLLGAYSGWVVDMAELNIEPGKYPKDEIVRAADIFAAAILGFILTPLLVHFNTKTRSCSYPELFETAWRNTVVSISAFFLHSIFWLILYAGAALMGLIGLNFVKELFATPLFYFPVSGIAFAAAYAMCLERVEMVMTLRRFKLSLLAWLLPLLLLFALAWVVALPFTGVELLFNTHSAAFLLLWCAALCISFVNAAYQDGMTAPPYGKYLNKALAWGWLSLPVVVAIAGWAMWMRIDQYGLSEDRVWGVFVWLIVTVHVLGYAASALRSKGWLASIGNTNKWSAVAICIGLIALLTPIADARRIAVNNQMNRLTSQITPSDQFDFDYLRWQAGKYGQEALRKIESGITHPDNAILATKAKQILAQKQRYQNAESVKTLNMDDLRNRIQVLPKNSSQRDKVLSAMQTEINDWSLQQCFISTAKCTVWLTDLNADSHPDAIVLINRDWGIAPTARILQYHQGGYKPVGNMTLPGNTSYAQLLELIEQGKFKTVMPVWQELELTGKRLQITLDREY